MEPYAMKADEVNRYFTPPLVTAGTTENQDKPSREVQKVQCEWCSKTILPHNMTKHKKVCRSAPKDDKQSITPIKRTAGEALEPQEA